MKIDHDVFQFQSKSKQIICSLLILNYKWNYVIQFKTKAVNKIVKNEISLNYGCLYSLEHKFKATKKYDTIN